MSAGKWPKRQSRRARAASGVTSLELEILLDSPPEDPDGAQADLFHLSAEETQTLNMPLARFSQCLPWFIPFITPKCGVLMNTLVSSIAVASSVQKEHCRECLSVTLGFSEIGI